MTTAKDKRPPKSLSKFEGRVTFRSISTYHTLPFPGSELRV